MEIERKFLLAKPLFDLEGYRKIDISQAYVSQSPVIRVRRADGDYFLTVKGRGRIAKEEFELPISRSQFDRLLKKTENNIIRKTRYLIPIDGGLTAEMDEYHSPDYLSGLFTVEVEFATLAKAKEFVPPEWFGRDVSGDRAYSNAALSAKKPESNG